MSRKALLDSEIQNTTPSEISSTAPVLHSPEVRRQAFKSKFGMKVMSPPPRASIDNFMPVYKPSNTKYNGEKFLINKNFASNKSNLLIYFSILFSME
jgi:hypothetical protein